MGEMIGTIEFGPEMLGYLDINRIGQQIKMPPMYYSCPDIDRVIVHKPAVVVYWKDGTKTVVKKQKGDKWDPEKGVAMAVCKRLWGNTGRYNDVIRRALEGARNGR